MLCYYQVDDVIAADGTLGPLKFVSTKVFRFRKGPEVPVGVFPAIRPDPNAITDCPVTALNVLSIPSHLTRTDGAGDVAPSASATYSCSGGDDEIMLTESGDAGRFQAGQVLSLACAADGKSFSSPSAWPACVDATAAECTVPAPVGTKGFNADPDSGAPASPIRKGDTLVYSCTDGSHEVGTSGSSSLTVTCSASELASSPYWQLTWDRAEADWPECAVQAASPPANCPDTVVADLAVPAHLTRSDSGEVTHGADATFACANSDVMLSDSEAAGTYVAGQVFTVPCDDGAFTAPAAWPVCADASTQV